MKDIIAHSKSLMYAVVERGTKIYAMERKNIMKSDTILVWTSTMLNARAWKGAIISDRIEGYDRQWSPAHHRELIDKEFRTDAVQVHNRCISGAEEVHNRCNNDTGEQL